MTWRSHRTALWALGTTILALAPAAASMADDIPNVPELLRRLAAEGRFPDNICYAEGTSPDYVEAIERLRQRVAEDDEPPGYRLTTRWPGSNGDPIDLSWSIVPDGLIADGDASTFFATMDDQFEPFGGREEWLARVQATFDRWQELTGINFTRVTNGINDWDDGASWGTSGNDTTHGDIRLAMTVIDGASGILGYADFPSIGDIVFDSAETWTSDTFQHNVMTHEMGHAIGLLHVCPQDATKLMEPFLNTNFEGPQHDDIRGAQRYYGDIYEGNNTSSAAPLITSFSMDGSFSLGTPPEPDTNNGSQLSIDADAEVDYFKFHVDYPGTVDLFVTPLGFAYLEGPQNVDGSCSAGTLIDSGDYANLGIEIRDTDGVTILASANVNGVGLFEIVTDVVLDEANDYFIRIFESNSFSFVQGYRMTLTADLDTPPPPDSDGDGVPDDTDSCPDTPAGEPVDTDGCSASQLDSDGDGVNDADDLCPDTPAGTEVDENGCPIVPLCDGDANGDGTVDPLDSGFVAARLGCSVGTGDTGCDAADVNADGVVDPLDIGFVQARYGLCE